MKEFFEKIRDNSKILVDKFKNFIKNKQVSEFQDLTPKNDVDLTGYKEALNHAFKKDEIKNIAITGSYGSGKSSILNTYKKNSKLKFIHISFLHFKECDKNDTNTNENKEKNNNDKEDSKESKDIEENKEQDSDNKDIEENNEDKDTTKIEFSLDCENETKNEIDKDKIREAVLERKIINHIINQIPFKYISDTNFNIRSVLGTFEIFKKIVYTLILIGSILYINYFLTEDKSNFYNFLNSSLSNINHILLVIGIFNIGFFIYKNFSNKYKEKTIKFLKKIMLLIFPIISFTYLVVYIWFNDILNELIYKFKDSYTLVSLSFLYIIIYFSIFIGKLNKKSILNKLKYKYKGIELDISTQKNGKEYNSFFDKYLNEILYIFENCNADVIVFEDIDRFEMGVIFERLREINLLLNEKLKKKNKVIKFCYLMKDDIFSSEDKVKFFDFIIPVMSVMNGFNSYYKFLEYLNYKEIINVIDKEFLKKISYYITNARLLKNICNEFLIYNKRFENIYLNFKLDYNKILFIVIYKNLFPKDFNNLNYNKGFLFNIIGDSGVKKELLYELEKYLNDKLDRYREKIEFIINILKNHYSLEISKYAIENYIFYLLMTRLDNDYKFIIENTEIYNYIKFCYNSNRRKYESHSREIINNKDLVYDIIMKNNILDLKLKILMWKYFVECTKEGIYKYTHRLEIFEKVFKKIIVNFKEIEKKYHDVLWDLIEFGIIDNMEQTYRCTFDNISDVKNNDKIFILNLFIGRENLGFEYKLNDIEFILIECNYIHCINNKAILNFYLLEYLLLKTRSFNNYENKKYSNHLVCILLQLKCENNFNFVVKFFNKTMFGNKECDDYFKSTLIFLDIKFENIYNDDIHDNLLYTVEKYNLYEINNINIKVLLKKLNSDYTEEEIAHKNYSLICKYKDGSLYRYIHDNIHKYLFEYVYNICGTIIEDDENDVINLINFVLIDGVIFNDEEKGFIVLNTYFGCLRTKINYINLINTSILENKVKYKFIKCVFANTSVKYFVENIYNYYLIIEKIDDELIIFINLSNKKLKFYNRCSDYDIEDVRVFLNELKNDERIKEDKRTEIQFCIDELDKF